MVVQSGNDAVANANKYKTNRVGMCLQYVRTWLEIPAGNPSAIAAWNAAKRKHVNGRDKDAQSPPRGAPVFWGGGKYGHIALAVNNDLGRSTDTTRAGQVSTQNGNWWRVNWNKPYLGWTEDLNGVTIPWLHNPVTPWSTGAVYVSKLKAGQLNSDSVSRLRHRLSTHQAIPASVRPGEGNDYGAAVIAASMFWQRRVASQVNGPNDGRSWSNPQANTIFGDTYTVFEE